MSPPAEISPFLSSNPDLESMLDKNCDDSIDLSKNKKKYENENYENNNIQNLGDYPIFGLWSIFVLFLSEFLILSQMSNMTFMVYGGLTPQITGCGDENYENFSKSDICFKIDEILQNQTCKIQKINQFNSISNEFDYFCSTTFQIKNSISIQMTGVLIGAILFGQLSDLYGRRKIMIICSIGMMIFDLFASFSSNLFYFTWLQFITMFFTGGSNSIGNVYVIENLPKKHRAWATLMISFSPNYILVAIIAYFAQDWRILLRIFSGINVVTIILLLIAYESPRWLVQNGNLKEAKEIYEKIEKINNSSTPLRQMILDELIRREVIILEEKKKTKNYYYWHLFYTWKMIKFTGILSFSLFCTAMITYALMFDMEQLSGSIYINNILLGAFRYVFNIAFSFIDYKFPSIGRKFIQKWSIIFVLLSMGTVFVLKVFGLHYPMLTTFSVLIAAAMTSQLFVVGIVVTGELFPTPIRNIAASFQQMFTRFGAVLSPHVFWTTSTLWLPLPYLFMGSLMLINLILFEIFIPESKGTPMSDHMPPKEDRIFAKKKSKQEIVYL